MRKEVTEKVMRDFRTEKALKSAARDGTYNRVEVTSPEHRGYNLGAVVDALHKLRKDPDPPDRSKAMDLAAAFADMAASDLNQAQRKTMVEGTPASGGYLTPTDRQTLLHYARQESVALRYARVVKMNTDKTTLPREDATLDLGFTDESTEAAETSATFTEVEVSTNDLDGYCDVSMHLEQDSDTPLVSMLMAQFFEAYGQRIDSAVFQGAGDPMSGVFTSYGRSEVFSSGSTDFSELLVSNLVNAVGKLEKPRRRNAAWFADRTSLWQYVYNLTEDSKHVLVPNWGSGASPSILGYPAEETEYAPDNGSDTAMLVFGNLRSVIIGDRLTNMTLFRDPYSLSTYHYVRYVFWTRVGFANALPNALVGVVTAAS